MPVPWIQYGNLQLRLEQFALKDAARPGARGGNAYAATGGTSTTSASTGAFRVVATKTRAARMGGEKPAADTTSFAS